MEETEGRTRRSWPLIVVLVIALAATAGGAVWGYGIYTARTGAVTQLAEATERLEVADTVVIEVDEVVRAPVEPALAQKASDAKDKIDGALGDLSSAVELIDGARADLPDDEVERADALRASAEARRLMLEHAGEILDANIAAAAALAEANPAWDLVLEAEKLADDAVVEYNKLTKDAVAKSKDLGTQAERTFQEAKAKFESAEKAFPDATLEQFVDFVSKKLALIALSKQADEAFLAGKNAQANEFSNQYNAKDKELSEAAKQLPESPSAAIAEAFEARASDASEAYFQAREEATKADANLRRITGD